MTIGGIIFAIILTIGILIFGGLCLTDYCETTIGKVASVVILVIAMVALWGGLLWYYNCTESGKRALKTQESELNGGITREVKVYDMEGDLVQSYKGKFDVDYDDDRIVFDDENGLRHIIYYPTGTVVIDEVAE